MSLRIIKAGLLDTIQDTGRWGYQHAGITVGGVMDTYAAQLANALLGKELSLPVVELHFPAAEFLFEQATIICLTGADFSPAINGKRISLYQPVVVGKGAQLRFTALKRGARCYLSVLHTLALDNWLGSYSTASNIRAGGYKGRSLQKGDSIPFLNALTIEKLLQSELCTSLSWRVKAEASRDTIQFIVGNEWQFLSTKTQTDFLNNLFMITAQSDRMGYRLSGVPLQMENQTQLISTAVSFGTIQLLPSGQLIVLMADHQTTGGYPRIGHIISAHLPYLAQAQPNQTFRFSMTTIKNAEEKLVQQQQYLKQVQTGGKFKMDKLLYAQH